MFDTKYRITSCSCNNHAEVNERGEIVLGFAQRPMFCPICGKMFRVELIRDSERKELKSSIDKLTIEVETLRKYRKKCIPNLEKEYKLKRDELAEKVKRYKLIK
ncbi:MAG: hypothetical protein PHE21_03980 [Candidatus Dojkabacteria bacterium]|nr:hypothetical protein [Candidatus Dojkabacteria bacterium]